MQSPDGIALSNKLILSDKMKYMKKSQLVKLIKKREKEGVICIPTAFGYNFYDFSGNETTIKAIGCKS